MRQDEEEEEEQKEKNKKTYLMLRKFEEFHKPSSIPIKFHN
jgi:hypothetical protein